ncbi:helix-turn-helix transcriptional regulator [Trebonia kvetii]|nr:WYL domain-containing protein [Trebonia kvetii]
MRADRLVSLALLLQARGRMSADDLAAELEVSVRTIYRDISALNTAGIPVLAEPGRSGGCRLVDGYRFPLRGLSPDEAEALLILGVPAAIADLGLADTLSAAHRKVSTSAGTAAGQPRPGPPLVHLDMPRWFHGTEPVPHLRTLAEAVRLGRGVELGYRRDQGASGNGASGDGASGDGAAPGGGAGPDAGSRVPDKTRVVGPLGLVNKAGTWYLVAARHPAPGDRNGDVREKRQHGGDPAVFRVGRVTAARLLAAVGVTRPDGFDLAAFWERWSAAFVTSRSQVLVRVRATAAALAIFPYVFGDAGRRAAAAAGPADAEGLREVTLSFEEEAVAAHRLAGFGGDLRVIEPEAVRHGLIATARDLLARYDPPANAGFAR